jgi:hypothetical protein
MKQCLISFLKLRIKLHRSALIYDVDKLPHIEKHEAKVPREYIWGTDDIPRPK